MTMTEVREIKERISLETANLKGKDLHNYYSLKAKEMQDKINKPRDPDSVVENTSVTVSVH